MQGNVSRRGFLAAGAVGAAMVGAGGFGAVTRQVDAAFVRPPGARGAAHLVSACNRCSRCVQACPYGIVSPVPLVESIVGYGTPQLVFEHGACDFCMECVEACPTSALSFGGERERDCGVAVVVRDACVAWDWSGCTVCVDRCPVEGAVTLDAQSRPVVHAEYCDGCGVCEQVCPSASLRAYDPNAADKGIVVVSRASEAAYEAFGGAPGEGAAIDGVRLEELRTVPVASGGALAPHSAGVHPDGPGAWRDAATGAAVSGPGRGSDAGASAAASGASAEGQGAGTDEGSAS